MTLRIPLPSLWLAACVFVAIGLTALLPSGPPMVADIVVASATD